jgi:hypothetical protein
MSEAIFTIPVSGTINIQGDSVTLRVRESILTIKIEGKVSEPGKRLRLESGKTLFDLVLDAAKTLVEDFGLSEFSAADLYHVAVDKHPELNLKRNSWGSHVVSSAPDHPSYGHYTSHRKYFRYLGRGKYSLEPNLIL